MNIQTRHRIATGTAFAVIATIAAALSWAELEEQWSRNQRDLSRQLALEILNLRMVTFEYGLERLERARVQWLAVSRRLEAMVAGMDASEAEAARALDRIRSRTATAAALFAELPPARATPLTAAAAEEERSFDAQVLGRLLSAQQDSLADAYHLTDLATERIVVAERRMEAAAWAGIVVLALHAGSLSWLFSRRVLGPIERLRAATLEVAAGKWDFQSYKVGNDEIGDLFRNFDAMVRSLRASFAEMEAANGTLAAVNKEMEAFSYSVSHDLRAPLRSLDGFSLVLLQDYGGKLDAEGRDALERIRAASQRMGALIDDLLRLSRVTRANLNPARVDLAVMAREIAADLEREEPGRRVQWSIDEPMTIEADPALIRIALSNLVQNAWKFTGRKEAAAIRIGMREREGRPEVFVSDNGAGFDMAYAGQLFGAFQRLHRTEDFPGTGIGLAIVARIVRRHGGAVRAEARPDEGATFSFDVGTPEARSDG